MFMILRTQWANALPDTSSHTHRSQTIARSLNLLRGSRRANVEVITAKWQLQSESYPYIHFMRLQAWM